MTSLNQDQDQDQGKIPNHFLEKKKIVNQKGCQYFIDGVYEQDYKGKYLVLLTSQNHVSHDIVFWENISSKSKMIEKIVKRNRGEMKLM